MQQHFWRKDSLQGVPNQDGKSRKFQRVAGCDKHPMEWKFRGGGGLKQKCPPFGGGGYGYFLELHNPFLPLWLLGVLILLWDCKSWKAILIILNPTNKTNIIMSCDHFTIILPSKWQVWKKLSLKQWQCLPSWRRSLHEWHALAKNSFVKAECDGLPKEKQHTIISSHFLKQTGRLCPKEELFSRFRYLKV